MNAKKHAGFYARRLRGSKFVYEVTTVDPILAVMETGEEIEIEIEKDGCLSIRGASAGIIVRPKGDNVIKVKVADI